MLNLLLGALVCLSCIAIGWYERTRYQKRVDVMGDLASLTVYLEEQIQYDMTPLPTIFERFALAHPSSAVAEALRRYPDVEEVTLPKGEWAEIREWMLSLGQSDLAGQRARLAFVRARIDERRLRAIGDYAKKGKLYAKLWCVLGVGLMIWMV